MLQQLSIKNFAVVTALDIELSRGLTVITGETGAGKSITVDALGLTLGDRADSGIVRDGTERAEITAAFDTSQLAAANHWLSRMDFTVDPNHNECILRRIVTREGRSKAYINGTPVTLQQLKELGEHLIDIHSQHEHQSLLKKDTYRKLVDAYADCSPLAKKVQSLYSERRQKAELLSELQARDAEDSAQQQLLSYQLNELEQLALQPGELDNLEQEQTRLANAEQIIREGQTAMALSSNPEGGEGDSARDLLARALRHVEEMGDAPELGDIKQLLNEAVIQAEEAGHSLQAYLERTEINPDRLAEVDERLGLCHQIARKHQVTPDQLLDKQAALQQELDQIIGADQHIEDLQVELTQLSKAYQKQADQLSAKRTKAAKKLNKEMKAILATLDMPDCVFEVRLTPYDDPFQRHGQEEIEFLVSANPGQAPRPLSKVASGGELSRISLALQVISAEHSTIPTLIFDEVDVGIGGATAETVGKLLNQLGDKGQVLCVTHQAQVAAQGHQHFQVSKQTSKGMTNSQITTLSGEEKVAEVARMLGGSELTPTLLAHAEELVNA